MENKRAKELIKNYLNGTCTDEEKAIIESWYLKETMERKSMENNPVDFFEIEDKILAELPIDNRKKRKVVWYGAAAIASIVFFSCFLYMGFYVKNSVTDPKNKITPGSNKAILTLSDGSRIDLSNADYGVLAAETDVHIRKTNDGEMVYDFVRDTSITELYNTIETPKGGQFQINLPDGTKVWLNAASSLKLPMVFGANERSVEITGEVYFEVAKHDVPFRVKTDDQIIEVLGTHFNVNAYPEESAVRTSLLEGSVSISTRSRKVVLKPGEQAVLSRKLGELNVLNIRPEDEVAWKNGYFNFNGESIEAVMNKIARWYDVDVEYHKDFVDQEYIGTVSRFEDVKKVLKMLELTGTVRFDVKGRRIIVMP